MRKILAIAWKDLRSTFRNVPALVMMLAAPLALAALLGFAFGGGNGGFDIAATKVVVANLDKGGAEAGQRRRRRHPEHPHEQRPQGRARDEHQELCRRRPAGRRRRQGGGGRHRPRGLQRRRVRQRPLRGRSGGALREPDQRIGGTIVEGVIGQVLADFNGARAAAAGAVALRSDAAGDPPAAQLAGVAAEQFCHAGGVSAGLQISQRSPKAGARKRRSASPAPSSPA